jgi:hypothetical protein
MPPEHASHLRCHSQLRQDFQLDRHAIRNIQNYHLGFAHKIPAKNISNLIGKQVQLHVIKYLYTHRNTETHTHTHTHTHKYMLRGEGASNAFSTQFITLDVPKRFEHANSLTDRLKLLATFTHALRSSLEPLSTWNHHVVTVLEPRWRHHLEP